MRYLSLLALALVFLLQGCQNESSSYLPSYSGRSGELIVILPRKADWDGALGDALKKSFGKEVYGLPQREPKFFMVTLPRDKFGRAFQTHRNIIILDRNSKEKEDITIVKDRWARGQIVTTIVGATDEAIVKQIEAHQERLVQVYRDKEVARLISRNKELGATALSDQMMKDHQMSVAMQEGSEIAISQEGFLWIRLEREKPLGGYQHQMSQGILVYYYDYQDTNSFADERILAIKDSMHQARVPGPKEGNYMTVVYDPIVPKSFELDFKGNYAKEIRGLWRMEGNFMGGPFITFSTVDPKRNRLITVEGYVYAPQFDKRELLREVEAMIKSLEFAD